MNEVAFLQASGLRFGYLERGEGPLVLLLHGFPDTAHSWAATRSALAAAGFRAVSPFLRGYHPSALCADGRYDVDTLGQDVLAWIDALGESRAVVVGHDWGAFASYAAAALAPDRVSFLVTVAIPHPLSLPIRPRVVWAARHVLRFQLPRAEEALRRNDFAYVDTLVRRWSPSWSFAPTETAAVKECFGRPGSVEAAIGYYRALATSVPRALVRPILVPCVAFAGDDDPIFEPTDFERGRARFHAGYEVVRMPGGHFLHREHPECFANELVRRVRAHADRPAARR